MDEDKHEFPKNRREIFCNRRLEQPIDLNRLAKSVFQRMRLQQVSGRPQALNRRKSLKTDLPVVGQSVLRRHSDYSISCYSISCTTVRVPMARSPV